MFLAKKIILKSLLFLVVFILPFSGVFTKRAEATVITASDTVQYASDDYVSKPYQPESYEKYKEITMTDSYTGSWRISFDLSGHDFGYARIYKNDQPWGTERSNTVPLKTFTEDFTNITINSGDKIQLYAYADPDSVDVANFRIYFSAPTVITASDTVQYASDKEEWVDLATYEKIKYLTIASSHTGTWRLTYDISTNRGGSEYEIRINGGAAIATNSTLVAYFTWDPNKSHDFSINLNTGDTVEIWGRSMLSSDFSGVKNFRIKFDESGGDTTPPLVSATYLPANPESTQTVNYTVNASDVSGIKEIGIIVDGLTKKTCLSTTTCNYVGGPYSEGTHNFTAYTYDNSVGLIYNSVSYSFMVITPGGSAVQSGCGVSYWESPTVYRSYNSCIINSNCPATIPGWIQSEIGYVGCDTYGCNSPSCGGCCMVVQIVWTKDPACDPGLGNPCNRNACGGTGVIQCDSTCSAPSPTLYGTADCNRNACGGTGVIDNCTGECSAPPPTLYGTADCNRNACGGTGVTDNCTGGCSAPKPSCDVCGDGVITGAEICESDADCAEGESCHICSICSTCDYSQKPTIGSKPIVCIVDDITSIILFYLSSISLLILILGGIIYIISGSNPSTQEKAKKTIQYALFGLALVLISYALMALIAAILVHP